MSVVTSLYNGTRYTVYDTGNAHHGSLKKPVLLTLGDNRPYKIIEDNRVIIIRNNEKFDITGKIL